jgi:hypothetical protein
MVPLSAPTRLRLESLFAASDRAAASELLVERCAESLPFHGAGSPESLERVRFAVLKLSQGDLRKLRSALELAETDWRDLLVAAGFANDITAHHHWWPQGSTR